MKKILGLSALVVSLSACTHSVHLVNFSDYRPYVELSRGREIEAKSEQFVVMSFAGQTDYVEEAYNKMLQQCPQGTISGISTQFVTSHGFFSWTNKILMKGLCLDKKVASK
ncbi:MAG: hypothetical protein AB7O96_05765 [Pseudobdellovibrionaceae bacterium]